MTEEQIALARRAVACKGWRWMPGMADCWGGRVREGDGLDRSSAFPDLTDPATMGCLLALVREAWELPLLGVAFDYDAGEWVVRSWNATILWKGIGASEAHALVAALEAAP